MDVTNQFQKMRIFFADDGLVTVLEEMAYPVIFSVEIDGVPRQELPHERRQPLWGAKE